MIQKTIAELFHRDLMKLKDEIKLYKQESDLWKVAPGISNSGGNLCLHLIGNLQHFIGADLGNTGFIRNRDAEFSDKDIPISDLVNSIEKLTPEVEHIISTLSDEKFHGDFPEAKRGKVETTDHMLMHLFGHLSYHLGQINYHRRLLS
ncbi:hypothetical protein BH11BAC2_BH11BAC2_10280 [soil metagenome]